jgi:hypothetical protein
MDLARHLLETILLPPQAQDPSLSRGSKIKPPPCGDLAAVEASGHDQLHPVALDSGGADIWWATIGLPAYNDIVADHKCGEKFAAL